MGLNSTAGVPLFGGAAAAALSAANPRLAAVPVPSAAASALQTSEVLRSMLADVESGDDEIGRMLRDLTSGVVQPRPAAQAAAAAAAAASKPSAAACKPPLPPGATPQAKPSSALLSIQAALDKAGSVEEIQQIVNQAFTLELQQQMGHSSTDDAAELRASYQALAQEKEAARAVAAAAEAAKQELESKLAALTRDNARLTELREQLQEDLSVAQSFGQQLGALRDANAALQAQKDDELLNAEAELVRLQAERDELRSTVRRTAEQNAGIEAKRQLARSGLSIGTSTSPRPAMQSVGVGSSFKGAASAAGLMTVQAFGDEVGSAGLQSLD